MTNKIERNKIICNDQFYKKFLKLTYYKFCRRKKFVFWYWPEFVSFEDDYNNLIFFFLVFWGSDIQTWNNEVYEGWLKSLLADQDTLMECDKMRFTFQHSSTCSPHISSIGVTVLGPHQSKKSSTADMTSWYKLFSLPSYIKIIKNYIWYLYFVH